MSKEMLTPVTVFWVSRTRRSDTDQLPYPEGFDEYASFEQNVKATPTGRLKYIAPGGSILIGTPEEIEEQLSEMPTKALLDGAKLARKLVEERLAHEDAAEKARQAIRIRHSGLNRNLKEETRLRGALEKLRTNSVLSDKELRFLIQYWGIMIRMCEIAGQTYYLPLRDAKATHEELLRIADDRGWTQSIISMYGGMVEGIFDKIC